MIDKLRHYLSMTNRQLIYLFVIVGTTQTIYSVSAIREVLYEPFRQALGTSNAAFGTLFGIVGLVQIFGYLAFGWLQDLINIRYLLALDLVGYGICALIMALVPHLPFAVLMVIFVGYGIFGDAIYWPTIQKSIKGISAENKQATIWGFVETWRGVTGVILNSLAVGLFAILGSSMFGIRTVLAAYAIMMILFAFVVLKFIPNDFLRHFQKDKTEDQAPTIDRKAAYAKVLRDPVVWLTGISASSIYAVFAGVTTYFVPFLQHSYALPAALVGVFGVVNGQVTRVIASGTSGFISDKRFKSSATWMAVNYTLISIVLAALIVMPRKPGFLVVMIPIMLLVAIFCYFIRGVYYAPLGEAGIPNEVSATAMSVASFIGYSPNFWAFTLFGYLLDKFPTNQAYRYIFSILLGLTLVGVVANFFNNRAIQAARAKRPYAGIIK